MKDFVEIVSSVSVDLPPMQRQSKICDLLLQELKTLKGRDLAPYLSELVFDLLEPGTKLVLKFPVGAHVFDTRCTDGKGNDIIPQQEAKLNI